ncbi:MAG: alpha/beta hydrolase, partial [Planctomycetaceae bacterium]|nr:alpha/beta hydrolase [Planctomycetaceae bacterium]
MSLRVSLLSCLALMVCTALSPIAVAEELPGVPLNVTPTFADVEYAQVKTDDGRTMPVKMNIYGPTGGNTGNSPVLVFVHGGAWSEGDYTIAKELSGRETNSNYHDWFAMRDKGVTIVTIGYRLSFDAIFPAQVHDVKGSIRYLRANKDKYGIDPDRIAIAGISAGAHLALMAALTGDVAELEGDTGGNLDQSSRVMACVDYYGMTDFTALAADIYDVPWLITGKDAYDLVDSPESSRSKLFGLNKADGLGAAVAQIGKTGSGYEDSIKLVRLGSPVYHVTPDDPPIFIGNGARDHRVPVAQARKLFSALEREGIESYLMVNSKVGHEDLGDIINKASVHFLLDQFGIKKSDSSTIKYRTENAVHHGGGDEGPHPFMY